MTTINFFRDLNETVLIVLVGNLKTGKSTIAKILSSKLKAEVLCGDDINVEKPNVFIPGFICIEAENLLKNKISVIIDSPNMTNEIRNPYLLRANIIGVKSLIIDCGKGNENDFESIINNDYQNFSTKKMKFKYLQETYEKPTAIYKNQYVIEKNELYEFISKNWQL